MTSPGRRQTRPAARFAATGDGFETAEVERRAMCGLAGIVGAAGPADFERVVGMLRAQSHRGQDGAGATVLDGAVLGHRRLAIHDPTSAGAQPFLTPDARRGAVVNGTFHNAEVLRARAVARGASLRGRSDCEVLLPLHASEGRDVVRDLRGPFAFAIYDATTRTVLLARDRFGKKPLFWSLNDGVLAFASEPGALALALGAKPRRDVLAGFFRRGYVAAPESPFDGVRALEPAHTLEWTIGEARPTIARYWTPPLADARATGDVDASFEALFVDAVRLRRTTDRPMGILLSGGVDSTAVLAAAAAAGALPEVALTGAIEDPALDESRTAAAVAAHFRVPHRLVPVAPFAADVLLRLVRTGDLLADSSALALGAVTAAVRDESPVLWCGDGGDELFLGYDRQRAVAFRAGRLRAAALIAKLPGASRLPRIRKAAAAAGLTARRAYAELSALATSAELRTWLVPDVLRDPDPLYAAYEREPESPDALADLARLDLATYLPGDLMTKCDRAAMSHGVEVWSPFLDPPLVDFALRLPGALRSDRRTSKRPIRAFLARRGVADLVAPRKRGFGVPLRSWLLEGPLATLAAEALHDVREPFRGVLKRGTAAPLLKALRDGEPVAPLVYACLVAALHHDAFA